MARSITRRPTKNGGDEQQHQPEPYNAQVEADDEFPVGDQQLGSLDGQHGGNGCQGGDGAKYMTYPVTRRITVAVASSAFITIFPCSPIEAVAMPKKTAKTTICRISLLAIASKMLRERHG